MTLETENIDTFHFLPIRKIEKIIDFFRFRLPVDNLENGKCIDFFRFFRIGNVGKSIDIFLSDSEENYIYYVYVFFRRRQGEKYVWGTPSPHTQYFPFP